MAPNGLEKDYDCYGFFFLDNTEDCDFNGILIIIIPENLLIKPIYINSN